MPQIALAGQAQAKPLAAFIGQHTQGDAIAAGRSDDKGAELQREFGRQILSKMDALQRTIHVCWSSSGLYNTIVFARQFMQWQDYVLPGFMKKNRRVIPALAVASGL